MKKIVRSADEIDADGDIDRIAGGALRDDHIGDKLADVLFLLDEALELIPADGIERLERYTKPYIEDAYRSVNEAMKYLVH